MWLIDGDGLFEFLSEHLVKQTGAFTKGVNKGLNIARSAIRDIDAVKPIDPEDLPIVQELRVELAKVTEERDCAVKSLKQLNDKTGNCYGCKWYDEADDKCKSRENKIVCDTGDNNRWEWKGI